MSDSPEASADYSDETMIEEMDRLHPNEMAAARLKIHRPHWRIRVKWEPRDFWVGVFVDRSYRVGLFGRRTVHRVYVCLIPCLPIVITRVGRYVR